MLLNQNFHTQYISNYTISRPTCIGGWPLSKLEYSNKLFYHYKCIIFYQAFSIGVDPYGWRSEAETYSRRHCIIAYVLCTQISLFIIRITKLCCQISLPWPVEEYCHLSRIASSYVNHLRATIIFKCAIGFKLRDNIPVPLMLSFHNGVLLTLNIYQVIITNNLMSYLT
jgi:hypothetical protein